MRMLIRPGSVSRPVRSVRLVGVALLVLVAVSPGGWGADPSLVHLDWESGTSVVGLHGVGHEAVNEIRFPFDVGPCHRDLRLDLLYEPASTGKPDGSDPRIPYVFHAAVHRADGSLFSERSLSESRHGYPMGILPAAGTYELMVRLDVGVMVDWEVRVRGWEVHGEASCDVYLNEVEVNAGEVGVEWVELYNRGGAPFDVGGWTVRGESWATLPDAAPYVVPNNTTVPAGGHVRIDLLHELDLGDSNETVVFGDPQGRPLDRSVVLSDTAADARTWGRASDGAGSWVFGDATPGTANGA